MNFPFPLRGEGQHPPPREDVAREHAPGDSAATSPPSDAAHNPAGMRADTGTPAVSLDPALRSERQRLDARREEIIATMAAMEDELSAIARRAEMVDALMEPHADMPDRLSA